MAKKKQIVEMLPVKTRLSQAEAEAFVDMGNDRFMDFVHEKKLSVRGFGAKRWYNKDQINKAISERVILN